jgi:hypothetical protein
VTESVGFRKEQHNVSNVLSDRLLLMLPVPGDWSLAFFRRAPYVFPTALRIASGGFLRVLTLAFFL